MQELTLDSFLAKNRWVSDAVVSHSAARRGEVHIGLDISPEGHQLIRDHGIEAFESKIQAKLSSISSRAASWEFHSRHVDVWGQPDPELVHRFPLVLSRLDDRPHHRLLISVSPGLDCFRGHFPGNPILAGVTQLHWAANASCSLYGFDEPPKDIKRLKFKNVVSPPAVLELALSRTSEYAVKFEFTSPGQVHSEGSLIFDGGIRC